LEKETAMSATATLRNTDVNTNLPNDPVGRLLNSAKENIAALAAAISELVMPAAGESDIRKLYRLSRGGDSVNPQVLEALRKAHAAE
jgi:hypothetical protein